MMLYKNETLIVEIGNKIYECKIISSTVDIMFKNETRKEPKVNLVLDVATIGKFSTTIQESELYKCVNDYMENDRVSLNVVPRTFFAIQDEIKFMSFENYLCENEDTKLAVLYKKSKTGIRPEIVDFIETDFENLNLLVGTYDFVSKAFKISKEMDKRNYYISLDDYFRRNPITCISF